MNSFLNRGGIVLCYDWVCVAVLLVRIGAGVGRGLKIFKKGFHAPAVLCLPAAYAEKRHPVGGGTNTIQCVGYNCWPENKGKRSLISFLDLYVMKPSFRGLLAHNRRLVGPSRRIETTVSQDETTPEGELIAIKILSQYPPWPVWSCVPT